MEPPPTPGLWSLLPGSLRRAGVLALTTAVLAAVLLVQTNIGSEVPPEFSRGGDFAGSDRAITFENLGLSSPTPRPAATLRPRSEAVLSAPSTPEPANAISGGGAGFPTIGTYVYAVEGSEQATAFRSRAYPPEMTMTVHRPAGIEGGGELDDDEMVFDLFFSEEHEERQIAAYRTDGIVFTYEAGSVTFGPITRTSEADYEPAMLQIPLPLTEGAEESGTSHAISPSGQEQRVEDWTVTVEGVEEVEAIGEVVSAWVVSIERQSRPGSAEQVTRTRTYWFDPTRSIWVKWEETMSASESFGPGTFTYNTEFTAMLERIEAL